MGGRQLESAEMEPRLVFDAGDIVGESAVYDERRDALVWVDIGGKRIHRLWLADRRHEAWPTPDFPTSIGLRTDGGAIVGLRDRVSEGDPVIVDAETGEAYLRPRHDVVEALKARMAVRDQRRAEFARLRDTPAFTRDGAKISLLMNAGLAVDLDMLPETGAEGIGLFRTEFQFMVS